VILGCTAEEAAVLNPVLRVLANSIVRVGPVGSVVTLRLATASLLAAEQAALAQALRYCRDAGLGAATLQRSFIGELMRHCSGEHSGPRPWPLPRSGSSRLHEDVRVAVADAAARGGSLDVADSAIRFLASLEAAAAEQWYHVDCDVDVQDVDPAVPGQTDLIPLPRRSASGREAADL
jgi:3-hydroxyisobutyrate dehydrogenase-like beta-hydroxyacid dehydrogenase